MFLKSTVSPICFDTPFEKAAICSWMYTRKVSLLQRPIFWIVLSGILFRCIAVAPPARKLCELTSDGRIPCLSSRSFLTVACSARVMHPTLSARPSGYWGEKNVPMIVVISVVWVKMCLTCRISACTGQGVVAVTSWCIVWARFPFFWFEMLRVPSVVWLKRTRSGSECGRMVFPFQKITSQTRNCLVLRRCFGFTNVYSPPRRR